MTVGEFKEYIKNVSDDVEIVIEIDRFFTFKKSDSYCTNVYDKNTGLRKDIIVICEADN